MKKRKKLTNQVLALRKLTFLEEGKAIKNKIMHQVVRSVKKNKGE